MTEGDRWKIMEWYARHADEEVGPDETMGEVAKRLKDRLGLSDHPTRETLRGIANKRMMAGGPPWPGRKGYCAATAQKQAANGEQLNGVAQELTKIRSTLNLAAKWAEQVNGELKEITPWLTKTNQILGKILDRLAAVESRLSAMERQPEPQGS